MILFIIFVIFVIIFNDFYFLFVTIFKENHYKWLKTCTDTFFKCSNPKLVILHKIISYQTNNQKPTLTNKMLHHSTHSFYSTLR